MFETRIFDLVGYDLMHIAFVDGRFFEIYSAMHGENSVYILSAVTQYEHKNLENVRNKLDEDVILADNTFEIGSVCRRYLLIKDCEIESIIKSTVFSEEEIQLSIVKSEISDLIEEAPYLDFSYNRYDVLGVQYKVLCLDNKTDKVYVPYFVEKEILKLGVSFSPIDRKMLEKILDWLSQNENAAKIEMMFCLPYCKSLAARNNFSIELPKTSELLFSRVKKKTRGNVRREWKYFTEYVGEVDFIHYEINEITEDLVQEYFDMKYSTHKCQYDMSCIEYLKKYYVSDAYTLEKNGKKYAILFSCQNTKIAYLENFSYDKEYEKFSLGTIIYWKWLEQLILNGNKSLYLAGGNYIYKKHFDSNNELCFSGEIVL